MLAPFISPMTTDERALLWTCGFPKMVWFTSCKDQNVPQRSLNCRILSAGPLLCHALQILLYFL